MMSCYNSVAHMQVDELTDEFDARRSTGYLCAATAGNFEQVILSAKCSNFIIILWKLKYLLEEI